MQVPNKIVLVRRWELVMLALLSVMISAILAAVIAYKSAPTPIFAPFSVQGPICLVNGAPAVLNNSCPSASSVPVTMPDQPIIVNTMTWCSKSKETLTVRVSATAIDIEPGPLQASLLFISLPQTVERGCTTGHQLNFKTLVPLTRGSWIISFNFNVVDNGKTQSVTVLSQPFREVGTP